MMRLLRWHIAIALAFVLALGVLLRAQAARPEPMHLIRSYSFTGTFNYTGNCPDSTPAGRIIESQTSITSFVDPAVVNEVTGLVGAVCAPAGLTTQWNGDDIAERDAAGRITAGEAFTVTVPWLLDNYAHGIYFRLAQGQGRTARLTFAVSEIGFSYSLDITTEGRFCLLGPAHTLADLPIVAGSNGGRAVPATLTWAVTATDRRGSGNDALLSAAVFYPTPGAQDAYCGGHTSTYLSDHWSLVGP